MHGNYILNNRGGGISVETAYKSKNVKLSMGEFKEGYLPSQGFLESKDANDYKIWKDMWDRYIHFNESTKRYLEEGYNKIIKEAGTTKILGVLCRGTDYFSMELGTKGGEDKLPIVIEKVKDTMKRYECKKLFFATEDAGILRYFENEFPNDILYIDDDRVDMREEKLIGNVWKELEIDLKAKGLNYILNVYILSKCMAFVGSRTSASVFLPIISDLKYMFFYDLANIEEDLLHEIDYSTLF